MNLLKKQLTTVLTLKLIDYYENADDIVLVININDYKWGMVLIQCAADSKQKQYPIRYESGVWSPQKAMYNAG